jgi:indole-3-glycerol phosphate synthase
MTILDQILDHKREEVARQKQAMPLSTLAARIAELEAPRDFAAALRQTGRVRLIAEVKKASPSRGVLLENFDHLALAAKYAANGAAAISVLTDERFFQGSLNYLADIRAAQSSAGPPLLRKDFIIDAYQIYESRAYCADALLLIVAALDDYTLAELLSLTQQLGLQALVEVHTEEELSRALAAGASIIGVNNRDLHSFNTTLNTTARIAACMPIGAARPLLVSESGIFSAADVATLSEYGVDAVLVGEAIVTSADMTAKIRELANVAATRTYH